MKKIFTLCLALLLVVGYCLAARVSAAVTFTYKVVNGGATMQSWLVENLYVQQAA